MSSGRKLAFVAGLFAAGLGIAFALEYGTAPRPRAARSGGAAEGPASVPGRVVAITPSLIECVYALGAGDRVVGVGSFCFYPPEARLQPRVGGEFNPNFERLLALRPDLVLVQGRAEKVADFCRQYAVPILQLPLDNLDELYGAVRQVGEALGLAAEADRLAARLRLDLAQVAWSVAGRPRPRVFLCTSHVPGSLRALGSTGGGTFLSEVLAIAGGDNVLADVAIPYPTVSKEQLVERAPDAIIELRPPSNPGERVSEAVRQQLLDDWRHLPSLPAVRDGRIAVLTEDYLLIPGPRVVLTARRLADVLHPQGLP